MDQHPRAHSKYRSRQVRRRRLTAILVLAMFALASASAGAVASRRHPHRPAAQSPALVHAVMASATGPLADAVMAGASPARTQSIECTSPALGGTLPALVYLPEGYFSGGRYAVIYFLHGLPAGPDTYTENAFVAQELARTRERAIVVAPQGARPADSDREYLDWSPSENWPRAIAHDLVGCIDSRYRTVADRYGRALVGLSAGGYGAFNIGLRNLQTFAAVESWSGYFVATDPSGLHALDLGSAQANAAAAVPRGSPLAQSLAAWPSLLAFYVGRSDVRFLSMNRQYDASLAQSGISHVFHVYPGGHSGSLWRTEAPGWLTMALRYDSTAARERSSNGGGTLSDQPPPSPASVPKRGTSRAGPAT